MWRISHPAPAPASQPYVVVILYIVVYFVYLSELGKTKITAEQETGFSFTHDTFRARPKKSPGSPMQQSLTDQPAWNQDEREGKGEGEKIRKIEKREQKISGRTS